ncbi:DNA repair protein rad18 [Xylaria nigripes]|nr:DNA repair protein rad18 [Xylaria nigripes]
MNTSDFDSVADSTDWLLTPLSGLSAVEAALRCQICKDFFKTPMLTSCNHTFCSLCIRRALSADGKCPLCRASEQEMKLRSNWSMEEVVAAFTQTRSAVLDFALRPPPSPSTPTILETPKRRGDDLKNGSEQPSSKRLRSSARLSKTKSMEATAEIARQESNIPDQEPDDGLVACPICWRRMKPGQVDRHIDASCPGPQSTPPPQQPSLQNSSKPTSITRAFAPSSSTTTTTKPQTTQPAPDRLPTLNYSMIKETQLRKELADLSLSTSGNRAMLERRHREWVMIWNANCDSQRPRRKVALLHDLDTWERTLGSRAPTGSRAANMGAQIRDKDFDGAAWATKHNLSYRDLIANARRTRARAQPKPDEDKSADETSAASKTDAPSPMETTADATPDACSMADSPPAQTIEASYRPAIPDNTEKLFEIKNDSLSASEIKRIDEGKGSDPMSI